MKKTGVALAASFLSLILLARLLVEPLTVEEQTAESKGTFP
jgi:hypothetical protein